MSINYIPWTNDQSRLFTDTLHAYQGWEDASRRLRALAGTMTWKRVAGREYLVRVHDRRGRQTSLGPRSIETERLQAAFSSEKDEVVKRLRATETRLAELARFNQAARLGRLPRLVSRVLTVLDRRGVLGRNVHVLGTYALHAYETMAGAFFTGDLTATTDLDFLFDPRRTLRLGITGIQPTRLLDLLREAEPSLELTAPGAFSARARSGFLVDFIKAAQRPLARTRPDRARLAADDLQPAEIFDLRWRVNAPKIRSLAIGEDGFPVPMSVPDPRTFALYKFHISGLKDRNPRKRDRDMAQARALAALVEERLPAFPFDPEQLRMFPRPLSIGIAVNPLWKTASPDDDE